MIAVDAKIVNSSAATSSETVSNSSVVVGKLVSQLVD